MHRLEDEMAIVVVNKGLLSCDVWISVRNSEVLKLSNFKPSWVCNDVTCLLIAGVSERSSIKLEYI